MEWTQEEDDALRQLASEGLSSQTIGKRIGRSKNSVVGHARRIGVPLLQPRCTELYPISPGQWRKIDDLLALGCGPSEIKERIGYAGPREILSYRILCRPPQQTPKDRPAAPVIRLRPPKPVLHQPPARKPLPRCATCQWLSMDEPPWVFCGEPSAPGRSYCETHAKRAYVRMCEWREEVA